MARFVDIGLSVLEGFLVGLLAVMLILVFGNVVLRYGFNAGITVSEEVSRFLFVWITFLGAIPVMRQHGHLGVDALVGALPPLGRRLCRIAAGVLMLGCCAVLVWGAWGQTLLNLSNRAPVSGLPTALLYGTAVLSGIGIGLLIVVDLYRTVSRAGETGALVGRRYDP